MQKVLKGIGVVFGVIIFLLIAANSCIRVSGAGDERSKGIVVYWLTER